MRTSCASKRCTASTGTTMSASSLTCAFDPSSSHPLSLSCLKVVTAAALEKALLLRAFFFPSLSPQFLSTCNQQRRNAQKLICLSHLFFIFLVSLVSRIWCATPDLVPRGSFDILSCSTLKTRMVTARSTLVILTANYAL